MHFRRGHRELVTALMLVYKETKHYNSLVAILGFVRMVEAQKGVFSD